MSSSLPLAALKVTACRFAILGDFLDAQPYGNGHINDTFAAVFDQGGTRCATSSSASTATSSRSPSSSWRTWPT